MSIAPTLFTHRSWRSTAADGGLRASAALVTPLGPLVTAAHVDGHVLQPDAAATFADGADARLWVWEGGVFHAELLRAATPADAATGVVGGETAIWRLYAAERPAECQVSCRWPESATAAGDAPTSDAAAPGRVWRARGWCVRIAATAPDDAVHALADGIVASAPMERGARVEVRVAATWWRDDGAPARA